MKFKDVEFEKDVITLHKKTANLAIGINNIESIEYVRPTPLNYFLSGIAHGSSTYPGRLEIRTKIKIGKSKLHLVKIKYKEVIMLPSIYLEIIDPVNMLKWKQR